MFDVDLNPEFRKKKKKELVPISRMRGGAATPLENFLQGQGWGRRKVDT